MVGRIADPHQTVPISHCLRAASSTLCKCRRAGLLVADDVRAIAWLVTIGAEPRGLPLKLLVNARLVVPLVVPNTKANPRRGRRGADRVSAALGRALINAQMSGFGDEAEMRGR